MCDCMPELCVDTKYVCVQLWKLEKQTQRLEDGEVKEGSDEEK